jgi:iron complex transport system substrate-binding protein
MKRFVAVLLAAALLLSLAGCSAYRVRAAAVKTVSFTDSCGRRVEIPENLTRVAPSGAVATMLLAAVAPEYLVSVNATPSSSQYKYLPQNLLNLPTTGQMYGSKSTLNLETLLACKAQIVIDLGDKKDGMAAELDELQKKLGIPVIFIEADLSHMAEAFRTLGNILSGKQARGEELAAFCEETVKMAKENSAKIPASKRLSVLYTSGVSGLDTNAHGSIQAQVLDLVGAENAAVVEDVSNKGGGNTVNLEQLYQFDPDVIVFTAGSIYKTVASDPAWAQLRAVKDGKYYEIPALPYNWLSNPPSVNMILGIWWLGNLLYPDVYDYDMTAEAQKIFRLFWNYDLSDQEAAQLLGAES